MRIASSVRRGALVAYLALAIASRIWIAWRVDDDVPSLPTGMARAKVEAFAEGERVDQVLDVAYRTHGLPGPEAVVLLHGSPGSLQDFDALAERLAPEAFVVVPDLPGFGHSSRDVPEASFVAEADATLQLLDQLGVERFHAVGFSWGGGVAIELAARAPARVASLVLVSALGVQEHELLGHPELNHLVHRLQEILVAGLDLALPHFGAFDGGHGGRGFTRSFVDADQRPLRDELMRHAGPTLIVHGRDDFLVPLAAAREHHRIVPQSELVVVDGGHLVLWQHPDEVAHALHDWLLRSRAGTLTTRAQAEPARVRQAALPFDESRAGPQNGLGWAVFCLLVLAASLASEDLTCIGVGLLVAVGRVGALGGMAACVFALVVGDLMLYVGGRLVGAPLLARFRRDPGELAALRARFARRGGFALLAVRFLPGARLPTYVAAGVLHYPILRFTFWLTLAALAWTPLIVGATVVGGRLVGDRITSGAAGALLAGGLVASLALLARLLPRAASFRGRRLLRSQWQRFVRWEFWPIWAIYLPMLPAFAALAIRHGGLRVATLVNPPIPGGGLAGESKASIGALFELHPEHTIETEIVEPAPLADRCERVARFMHQRAIGFPIVLKPDVGERGRDVAIVADRDAVERHLASHPGRVLAQRYVEGEEFGLFYTRLPGAERGELFSIARKTPRFVTGNGRDSVERLILDDPICLPVAEKLFALQASRLAFVPASGEHVRLTQLGTHSKGCRFLYGEDLRTPALEAAVDQLSRAAGLDFGRYDVRAESEDALRAGRFFVVEFNGLTGESADMYDPRYGLGAGLRILRSQWRRAFEIGAAHQARGRAPLSWSRLIALVRAARAE